MSAHTQAASDSAGAHLLKALVTELKVQSPRFASQTQEAQQEVIDRLRGQVEHEVDQLVMRIATRSFPSAVAKMLSASIKDGFRVTLQLADGCSVLHDIVDHIGGSCWIVLCELEEFTGGMQTVKAPPNQRDLLNGGDPGDSP